jgi:hypothetical protein
MHTLKDLKTMARQHNKSQHIKIDQTKSDLVDDLRRHNVLQKNRERQKDSGMDQALCTDEEMKYVLERIHRKYFMRDRIRSSSSHRRHARKRRRDASRDTD